MSGVAATLIHGETTHMALGLNKRTDCTEPEECRAWRNSRMVIVDEISFADAATFEKMNKNLQQLMCQKFRPFGGINVVFSGDLHQLEPVQQQPVYKTFCPEFLDFVNCFIELAGMHRFEDDPEWGLWLQRMRNGNLTVEDVRLINENCLLTGREDIKPGIQVATATNKNRDSINTAAFEQWCLDNKNENCPEASVSGAVMIFMDELKAKDHKKCLTPMTNKHLCKKFYEECGETEISNSKDQRIRADPVLKLWTACPVMMTENEDVKNGKANGTRLRVKRVVLKPGEQTFQVELQKGLKVSAVFASQVDYLLVRHENEDVVPQEFKLEAKKVSFKTAIQGSLFDSSEQKLSMQGKQFPVVSNVATTGHKLQGCTMDEILINDWMMQQNWAYVVLSRVQTMKGVNIREKLPENLEQFKPNPRMKELLKHFEMNKNVIQLSDFQRAEMCLDDAELS